MLVFAGSCAHTEDRTADEVARLRRELHQVRSRLDETHTRIARLEARVEAQRTRAAPLPADESVPAAPEDRPLPVVRLTPDGEAVTKAPETPILIRLRGNEEGAVETSPPIVAAPAASLEDAETRYREALSTLREARDPVLAIERFGAFRRAHPDHRLLDNAVYWTGEAYMMLLEHERALTEFEALLARHPRSNKVPWAKLRAAESHLALGRVARGRTLLSAVTRDHPRTEPARLAADRLRTLSAHRDENRP